MIKDGFKESNLKKIGKIGNISKSKTKPGCMRLCGESEMNSSFPVPIRDDRLRQIPSILRRWPNIHRMNGSV